jgi:hypothetical protein
MIRDDRQGRTRRVPHRPLGPTSVRAARIGARSTAVVPTALSYVSRTFTGADDRDIGDGRDA